MEEQFAAVYLDFENLARSAEQTYPSKEKPLSMSSIVDFAANNRNICIKKAYSDWSKPLLARYQNELNEHGFEMIHLPGTSQQGKNGADLRMTIDVLEDLQSFPMINTFFIGSGDTDFIPLIRRILARGKKVIIIGFDNSVGRLVKNNCTQFKSLNELYGEFDQQDELDDSEKQDEQKTEIDIERLNARELLIRFIKNRSSDEPLLLAALKYNLLRLQPTFSEKRLGYSSFKKFLESFQDDIVQGFENDPVSGHPKVVFKDITVIPASQLDKEEEIRKFLNQNLKFIKERRTRHDIAKNLLKLFKEQKVVSMHDMTEYIAKNVNVVPKIAIRKYIFTIAQGRVFSYADDAHGGSLNLRSQKLNDTITNTDVIDSIYKKRIVEIILNRFSDIEEGQVNAFLI